MREKRLMPAATIGLGFHRTGAGAPRRNQCGVLAALGLGGVLVAAIAGIGEPSAIAAPDPCAASEIARSVGSVATSTGGYLDAHPETNQALTTISQQPAGPQSLVLLKSYFDANPHVGKDMLTIQRPLLSLSTQCKLPITIPQLLGLLQIAQAPSGGLGALPTGSVPAGLLGGLAARTPVGAPLAIAPAQLAPGAVTAPTTGPVAGPATTPTR